jgi:peptidyl-prolyl cis-trans isomerase B (cyclophilin B)
MIRKNSGSKPSSILAGAESRQLVKLIACEAPCAMLEFCVAITAKEKLMANRKAIIDTNKGSITIELYEDKAPITAGNFIDLIERGFYDGLSFHRYEPKFVIQGGDPVGNGTGGFKDPETGRERRIKLEVSRELKHGDAGGVAMARSQSPDSASSQFYITLGPAAFLDMNYAVFGRVTEGMDVVQQLRAGDTMTSVKLVD